MRMKSLARTFFLMIRPWQTSDPKWTLSHQSTTALPYHNVRDTSWPKAPISEHVKAIATRPGKAKTATPMNLGKEVMVESNEEENEAEAEAIARSKSGKKESDLGTSAPKEEVTCTCYHSLDS